MEKVLIAKILKPQGLKGEIKCKLDSLWGSSTYLFNTKTYKIYPSKFVQ